MKNTDKNTTGSSAKRAKRSTRKKAVEAVSVPISQPRADDKVQKIPVVQRKSLGTMSEEEQVDIIFHTQNIESMTGPAVGKIHHNEYEKVVKKHKK